MKIITISRQYGSGGRHIAALLSERLGVPFYDSNLLLKASDKHGISQEIMDEFGGKTSLLYGIGMMASEEPENIDRVTLPYKMYQAQRDAMKRLAQEGPCIFVGRCADQILKEDNQLFRVFIYASEMKDRVDRIKKNKNLSQREALERIAYKDRQRRDYYYFHTGQEWVRMENYDICLNTSALSDETCVRLLMKLAE